MFSNMTVYTGELNISISVSNLNTYMCVCRIFQKLVELLLNSLHAE